MDLGPSRATVQDVATPEDRRNFQAWVTPAAYAQLKSWMELQGITRTAFLEALADWLGEHGTLDGAGPEVLLRARVLTSERRAR